jgi:hypothetical protein
MDGIDEPESASVKRNSPEFIMVLTILSALFVPLLEAYGSILSR